MTLLDLIEIAQKVGATKRVRRINIKCSREYLVEKYEMHNMEGNIAKAEKYAILIGCKDHDMIPYASNGVIHPTYKDAIIFAMLGAGVYIDFNKIRIEP